MYSVCVFVEKNNYFKLRIVGVIGKETVLALLVIILTKKRLICSKK